MKQPKRSPEKKKAAPKPKATGSKTGEIVSVPKKMLPLFEEAQETVGKYFSSLEFNPEHGIIEINNERYVLVRASALAHDFLATIQQLYADRGKAKALSIGKNFLFDIGHLIGINDAIDFHKKMKLTDPVAKMAAGPVHFAYSGWASVEILPESKPQANENFFLIYRHSYSFEADSWLQAGIKSKKPVCVMNAGYSSGWCEESFGMPLTAVEVTCRAKGDSHCTFIMSPPEKILEHLSNYCNCNPTKDLQKPTFEIPAFFERKKMEEQLALYALIVESSDDAIISIDLNGVIKSWNPGATRIFGYTEDEVVGKNISNFVPKGRLQETRKLLNQVKKGTPLLQYESKRRHKAGHDIEMSLTASPVKNIQGKIIGTSIIGHDISKRKQAERALKELNNSLEHLVQERTSDLQRAYDELETRVTFRNLELERANKQNLAKIAALEKEIAALKKKA